MWKISKTTYRHVEMFVPILQIYIYIHKTKYIYIWFPHCSTMKSQHCRRLRLPQCQLEVWMIWMWFRYMEYPHISIWNPYGTIPINYIPDLKWYIKQAIWTCYITISCFSIPTRARLLSRSCVDLFFFVCWSWLLLVTIWDRSFLQFV